MDPEACRAFGYILSLPGTSTHGTTLMSGQLFVQLELLDYRIGIHLSGGTSFPCQMFINFRIRLAALPRSYRLLWCKITYGNGITPVSADKFRGSTPKGTF